MENWTVSSEQLVRPKAEQKRVRAWDGRVHVTSHVTGHVSVRRGRRLVQSSSDPQEVSKDRGLLQWMWLERSGSTPGMNWRQKYPAPVRNILRRKTSLCLSNLELSKVNA